MNTTYVEHNHQPTSPDRTPPLFVRAEHTIPDVDAFQRKIFEVMVNLPAHLQLHERFHSVDHTKEVLVWRADSFEGVKAFVERNFNDVSRFDLIATIGLLPPPRITSVLPFSSIRPGGGVIIQGTDFENQPGELHLVGDFPDGHLTLTGLQWGNTFAAGVIPNVFGVTDQQAYLQIVTRRGQESNFVPASFVAARDIRVLPHSALTVLNCGSGELFSSCGVAGSNHTVDGYHASGPGLNSGEGRDVLVCQLKNGWTFDHYEWKYQNGILGGPFGAAPDPAGSGNINLSIAWFYDVFGSAEYSLDVVITGPLGVPFQ